VGARGVELGRLPSHLRASFRAAGLVTIALVGSACDFGGGEAKNSPPPTSSNGGTTPAAPEIRSSLEGFAVLPRRVQWTVTTSLAPEQVKAVRFIVDGVRLWIDPDPPFEYGEHGAQLGTWMGPGRHRFDVRVVQTDGSRVSETVVARIRTPKTDTRVIDRGLSGAWGRLSKADLEMPPPPDKRPRFIAWMWINHSHTPAPRTLLVGPSIDHVFGYEYWIRAKTLYVGTAWFLDGPEGGDYWGWGVAGAFQCDPGAWPARYSWSSRRGRLLGRFNGEDSYAPYIVLNAEEEPCAKRRRMLEGVWEGLGT
jgi:hypothetical protein